jgi:pimeloyl-ACP methyl ester carboxylesterase
MPFMPLSILLGWLTGLLSLVLVGGGLYLIWAWYVGAVIGTGYLVGGLLMLLWTFAGRQIVLLFHPPGADEPKALRNGSVQRVARPEGSELQVELYGPPDAPPIVMIHGWGTNSTEWYYVKRQLADRFRLIVWDLPGLGESRQPHDNDYRPEKLARDLEAVLALAGNRPAILLGHSIGGMITLTFCRLFPQELGRRVAGLVLVDTTYTNPVRTTTFSGFFRAVQKPLLEPLLHLSVWLSPIVWLMNWLSYLNGTAHITALLTGFAGQETRGQLDFATRFTPMASPAVLARGGLAALKYDETATLGAIGVPVLVITGDLDRVTIPEANAHINEAVPRGRLLKLRPGGHMALLEQNERFAEAVAQFGVRCFEREHVQTAK